MNIHQFQYVLALAELRHFEKAAEKCFVTQSTLSTMISKLEDELGIPIFDRKKKPVALTAEGAVLLEQLKIVQREIESLKEISQEIKGEVKGRLIISVIPTIAPFLLPLFLHRFALQFPQLQIIVREQTTGEIIRQLKSRDIDIGIVSTPINDAEIEEQKLYHEPFVYYQAGKEPPKRIEAHELNLSNLALLEEGHCMRTQIIELCNYHENQLVNQLNFNFQAGSIDSLLRFVRGNGASTLLPYLSVYDFPKKESKHISRFSDPVPFREIGLVVHRHFVRKRILQVLEEEILKAVKPILPDIDFSGKRLSPL